MGNCNCVSSRTVVKAVSDSDPKSVFKYDKDTRKIVYIGEDNVDGDIHPAVTLSASASASASRENSDNGSISTTAENNGPDDDHLNENLSNVRSLLGEIAEYLDEDESSFATASVAGSQRSGSVTTTPTGHKSHDNSVVSISSRQAVSPLLFETEDGVQTPYNNDERSRKFEELVKMSKEQKMVESARNNMISNSPEADLVYKNPRDLYEDDSLLALNPSDEPSSPAGPIYAGRDEAEYGKKEEFWSTKTAFDDDLSNETSLEGIAHVLSEDASEGDLKVNEELKNLGNLLRGESDQEDVPSDEEDYGVERPTSPSPKAREASEPLTDTGDANTSNVSFGSFMHVSYVEGGHQEEEDDQVEEDDGQESKTIGNVSRDLIIFSPDADGMRKSAIITTLQEEGVVEENNAEESYVSSDDEEDQSQSTREEHEEVYSIVTEHAVNSSMVSEIICSNEDAEKLDSPEDNKRHYESYVQKEDAETQSRSTEEEFSEEDSVATQHATNSSMVSEVIVLTENSDVHVEDEVTDHDQGTNTSSVDKLKIVGQAVSHLDEEHESAGDIEEPTSITVEEYGHLGVTEIVQDLLCHPQQETNSISDGVELSNVDSEAATTQGTTSETADEPLSSIPVDTTEELQVQDESEACMVNPGSAKVVEKEEVEGSSCKESDDHINEDIIGTGECGNIESKEVPPMKEKQYSDNEDDSVAEINVVKEYTVVATANENDDDDINEDVIGTGECGNVEESKEVPPIKENQCNESKDDCVAEVNVVKAVVATANENDVTSVEHSDDDEKEDDLISDLKMEEFSDAPVYEIVVTGEENVTATEATEKVGNDIISPHNDSTEKVEENSNSREEADKSNASYDEYCEIMEDNLNSVENLLAEVKDTVVPKREKVAADVEMIGRKECSVTKEDDTILIEKIATTEKNNYDLLEEKVVVAQSSTKLADMENKLKELESFQFSEINASDENRTMKRTAPVVEGQKVKGSTPMKKRVSHQPRPKPRTPPRRHPTPTRSSILREQQLNAKNNQSISRGRSLTSRSRTSHRETGRRTAIGDDASVGSTNSMRSNMSGRSFNQTPQRTRRNSSNWKNTPDDASVQSHRSIRTPLTITPNSLPWDEKDLRRRAMSPAGSVSSTNSHLSDPELIKESHKTAHKRVVAVRTAEKKKKSTVCNRKWDTTLFEKKKGCIRCLVLASKKERNQYFSEGRHPRIAMTTGGCVKCCLPSSEFLRAHPELELEDEDEDIRLCRICFNAVHR